jgi:[acyl-carrier-protein] S-malonyltransferase
MREEKRISKLAFIFPGQGSQYVGMAADLHEQYPAAQQRYQLASEILGFDLAKVSFQGPEDELKETRVTQPAIFVHSVIVAELLRQRGLEPHLVAGHSLGEYSALYTAGAFSFQDGLRLVKIRAELMQAAGANSPGSMAAIIGLEAESLQEICKNASETGVVEIANYNSPAQLVISGSVSGVAKAMALAEQAGAKRTVPLPVSGAFHSPLMAYACEGLSEALAGARITTTSIPVYANVTAGPMTEPAEIREYLLKQLTSPVRWTESVRNMISAGASAFFETGPGSVLRGLLRRINRDVSGRAVGDLETLNTL